MPGIFGVVDTLLVGAEPQRQNLVAIVRRMSAAMRYEPFYSAHLASYPSLGACVGHVELDPPDGHGGPHRQGYPLVVTTGETTPEVSAIDVPGEEIVRSIAGRCAGFVADRRAAKCFLFNDRYGRERLFLHSDGSRTFFSSEAKAILAIAPRTRGFDSTGLAEFLACGCTLGSRSLYRDVEVLAPGTILTFDESGVRRRRSFRQEDLEALEPVSGTQFLEGFPGSLRAAVDRSVNGSPPVGMSLTGGLDSRMIMASLDAPAGSIPCYTFGSMYRTTSDVAVARAVAARCNQPHSVIELGAEFLAHFREHLEQSVYVSDGYLGLSGAAEIYVNRQARFLAPARMTGNWGGELMRGVRAFKFTFPKGGFVPPELARCMRESEEASSPPSSNSISGALFHQMPLQGYGRYAIERSQVTTRTPFLADDVVAWLYRAPAAVRAALQSASTVIGRRPELLAIPTDTGVFGTGPSAIRRPWRRALVKAEYLTSHGAPDWLARLSAWLPASVLEGRFLGVDKFYHFRFWTRRGLAEVLRDTLTRDTSVDLGAWFDMGKVAAVVNDHIAGRANYTDPLDKLLTVATTQKVLLGGDLGAGSRAIDHTECLVCDANSL